MAIAANDAADRVEQLIALTERLTGLLVEATRAYEERRPHEVAAASQETMRLANVYRHESMRVKRDVSLIADAPDELKRRLTQATEVFQSVLARHARAVEAALTITEGVVRAIAEEVGASRKVSAGYGREGKSAAPDSAPLAYNQKT
jgi:hypothetical protein